MWFRGRCYSQKKRHRLIFLLSKLPQITWSIHLKYYTTYNRLPSQCGRVDEAEADEEEHDRDDGHAPGGARAFGRRAHHGRLELPHQRAVGAHGRRHRRRKRRHTQALGDRAQRGQVRGGTRAQVSGPRLFQGKGSSRE